MGPVAVFFNPMGKFNINLVPSGERAGKSTNKQVAELKEVLKQISERKFRNDTPLSSSFRVVQR